MSYSLPSPPYFIFYWSIYNITDLHKLMLTSHECCSYWYSVDVYIYFRMGNTKCARMINGSSRFVQVRFVVMCESCWYVLINRLILVSVFTVPKQTQVMHSSYINKRMVCTHLYPSMYKKRPTASPYIKNILYGLITMAT